MLTWPFVNCGRLKIKTKRTLINKHVKRMIKSLVINLVVA